jgi:membrane fusion protein
MAPYARKETVSGYLMPTTGIARVHAPQPGIVSAIHVEDGQQVSEGQPLLSVATAQVAAEGGDVNAAILDALARQKALLAGQITADEQRAASEERRLRALAEGLGAETSHIEAQIGTQRERIALAENLVAAGSRLNTRGFVSDIELTRREELLLEHRQNLGVLGQQLAARRNQLIEHRFALEQLPIVTADRIRLLSGEISSAEQRIARSASAAPT